MSSSPSTRPMSRSPARDGLLQSTVPHPRRANSSAAGLRSGSEACCSHFLGSCRELTLHGSFCKTRVWKVSALLRFQGEVVDLPLHCSFHAHSNHSPP